MLRFCTQSSFFMQSYVLWCHLQELKQNQFPFSFVSTLTTHPPTAAHPPAAKKNKQQKYFYGMILFTSVSMLRV